MRRYPARTLVAIAPLLLFIPVQAGCDAGGASRPPDLVLIVIDTLRADHLGAYGYDRPTSPELDALADRGTLFSNATAPSSWTRPSMASLFTSRLPSAHGAVSSIAPLAPGLATLAERLREGGYRTVGVSGNFPHVNEKSGLSRGFESFLSLAMPAWDDDADTLMRLSLREGARPAPLRAPTAGEVNERVLEALSARDDGRPLFLYVHYMDPHSGYLAPESFRARFRTGAAGSLPAATSDHVVELAAGRVAPRPGERRHLVDLYDAEIAYVDAEIGSLLATLEREGSVRDPVIVVLSDHGEEFEDHGGWFHGLTLHRETLRVPLLIVGASGLAPGVRPDPVDLLDVPTTLLALAGLPPGEGMQGRDLRGSTQRSAPRIAELHPDPVREGKAGALRHRAAIDRWPYKALVDRSGGVTVYDLGRDPLERAPLAPTDPTVPPGLAELARGRAERVEAIGSATDREPDFDEREALRALGYAE